MNVLTDRIKPMYLKYLSTAFGSALITSIYGIVDMAMVGQYQGPDGSAALAVVAPIWNIIYSLGLLMGIGGSVLLSTLRGQSLKNIKISNEYYSAALIGTSVLSLICWIGLIFWNKELLIAFGAQGELLTLAQRYLFPIQFVVPAFLFNQMFAAFLRNDGNPTLATKAVLLGGILNVFGDYFFVFTLNMGIFGAGLATALGSVCSLIVMLSHFFNSKNTLQFVWPSHLLEKLRKISITGFSTFFTDVAMGILTVLFNRQIMKYLGTNALAVYAVIINISTFVQCCAYSVGQAAQPIISVNFGAHQGSRIQKTLKYALWTTAFFSLFWTGLSLLAPDLYIRIFMSPTPEVLAIAPSIIRTYALSFLLLPFNVFSTFYFQALMKSTASFIVSVTRGAIISGILIYVLPVLFGANALWLAMPITEFLVALYAIFAIIQTNKQLLR